MNKEYEYSFKVKNRKLFSNFKIVLFVHKHNKKI